MVSTENGHKSKKKRSGTATKSRRNKSQETYLNMHYDLPRSVFENRTQPVNNGEDEHLYDVVRSRDDTYENVSPRRSSLYQNVDGLYDHPREAAFIQSHYENLTFSDDHTYLNIERSAETDNHNGGTYDIPRSSVAIYDQPLPNGRTDSSSGENSLYDFPKSLIPLSARLLLNARNHEIVTGNKKDIVQEECDTDSLDDDRETASKHQHNMTDMSDRKSGASPDEGIGELDLKGLDVIAEENEEELYPNLVYAENTALKEVSQRLLLKSRKKAQETSKKRRNSSSEKMQSANDSSLSELESSSSASASMDDSASYGEPVGVKESPKLAHDDAADEAEKTQRDRCIEVYHETMRQRNSNKPKATTKDGDVATFQMTSAKEGTENLSTIRRMKKLLPSVKALRSQFEPKTPEVNKHLSGDLASSVRKWKSSSSFKDNSDAENSRSRSSSLGSLDEISSSSSHCSAKVSSQVATAEGPSPSHAAAPAKCVQSIIGEFVAMEKCDGDVCKPRLSTAQWDPTSLLAQLYSVDLLPDKTDDEDDKVQCINIEGYLEKLPSGRRKATFWNAWKSRFFRLKNGHLYYYQNNSSEKPNTVLKLHGGVVENMDNNMIGIDDGKGHYMVVRGSSKQETEHWYQALLTHVNHSVKTNYVQPTPVPRDPSLLKNVIIIDLGSSSVRAGILSNQATLPQLFFPSAAAVDKITGKFVAFGCQSLVPEVRTKTALTYPFRPSNKISKYMLDLEAVSGFVGTVFQQLNVDPSNYTVQISVPRHLNTETQAEILRILFDKFGVKAVNLTHQSILCLLSYNASSGIVVDIGERIDIVPVMDGYILESSASQVPYGGQQLVDHLRHFLVQQRCSLITDVESYLIRYVLEKLAYVAGPDVGGYGEELSRARKDPSTIRASVDLQPFSNGHLPWETISLELGRFQVTEGLFHPEAWGLDNSGVPTLVHKAIQDCSVDIRKEMARSIYLGGGVTLLPGFPERLEAEIAGLVPSHLTPKVHASPYRYHASYIGACVLGTSPSFDESRINREEWNTKGDIVVRKWKI